MRRLLAVVGACAAIAACAPQAPPPVASTASAAPNRSVAGATANDWYSEEQASQGAALFTQKCSVCHGASLQGGAGPALAGNQFFLRYGGKPLSQLWSDIHTKMPLNAPGTLSTSQSLALTAYILKQNGFPAGPSPIVGHYDALRIVPKSAPGAAGPQAVAAAPKAPMVVKQPSTNAPSQAELDASDAASDNWLTYSKGYGGSRYSPLADITAKNVAGLKPVCSVVLAPGGSFEGSPVAYNGVLYVTTTNGTFAIDGRSCAKLWSYDYVPVDVTAGANNKGVAIGGGRAIRGTTDGHLIALDIKTGELLWDRQIMDSSTGASAMAAPLIWHDLVFMGRAGGDVGVRGEIAAYRVSDGTKVWSFSTIPIDGATGAITWRKSASATHGGGGVWTYFTLDPKTGTLVVPVGNPGPDFDAAARPGANLFTTGVVALDARTGKLRWWYQTQPNDNHDWDATGSSQFDTSDGHELLAATAKDGFVYLLDRTNGKLLSKTATVTVANIAAPITASGTHYCPGVMGGSEWNGAAWSPTARLVYVNSIDWCVTVKGSALKSATNINNVLKGVAAGSTSFGGGIPVPDPMDKAFGWTTAVDPATGTPRWHLRMATPMVAGLTPTAGGLLLTGDLNGNFLALDTATGRTLFKYDTKGALAGGVITYRAGGKQYIAAATGNTSFVAWKVTGNPTLFVFGL